jgi:hypothetical protein
MKQNEPTELSRAAHLDVKDGVCDALCQLARVPQRQRSLDSLPAKHNLADL